MLDKFEGEGERSEKHQNIYRRDESDNPDERCFGVFSTSQVRKVETLFSFFFLHFTADKLEWRKIARALYIFLKLGESILTVVLLLIVHSWRGERPFQNNAVSKFATKNCFLAPKNGLLSK